MPARRPRSPRRRLPLLAPGGPYERLRASIARVVGEFTLVPAAAHGNLDIYRIEGTQGHGLLAERRDGRSRRGCHLSAWIAGHGRADSLVLEAELGPVDASWTVAPIEPGAIPAMLAGIDPESVRLLAARHESDLLEASDRLAWSRRARVDPEFARRQAARDRELRRALVLQRREAKRALRRMREISARYHEQRRRGEPVDPAELQAAFARLWEAYMTTLRGYGIDSDPKRTAIDADRPFTIEGLPPYDEEEPPIRRGPGH